MFFKGVDKNNKNPDRFKTLPFPQSFKVSLEQSSCKSYQNSLTCTQDEALSKKGPQGLLPFGAPLALLISNEKIITTTQKGNECSLQTKCLCKIPTPVFSSLVFSNPEPLIDTEAWLHRKGDNVFVSFYETMK